jgi:adenine phosphoribosyltransferase
MNLREIFKYVDDFPIEGVRFIDIQPIFLNADVFSKIIEEIADNLPEKPIKIVVNEARGFLLGTPLLLKKNAQIILARKEGKLSGELISKEYDLEYGTDKIEIQKGLISEGDEVAIIDDILATGGTTKATIELVESLGAKVVKIIYLDKVDGLNGLEMLNGYDVTIIHKDD